MKRFHNNSRFALENLETRKMMTADLAAAPESTNDAEDPTTFEWALSCCKMPNRLCRLAIVEWAAFVQ